MKESNKSLDVTLNRFAFKRTSARRSLKKMNKEKIHELMRKRVSNLKHGRWVILFAALFMLGASFIAYSQGSKLSESIKSEEYGSFFWNGVDENSHYSGWRILAENRYSSAALYFGGSILMFALFWSGIMTHRRELQIVELIKTLGSQPVDCDQ